MVQNAAVYRDKNILPFRSLTELHVIPQPALHPPPLIVIRASAFLCVFISALEAIDVEFPHIITYAVEIFYQLTVCHELISPPRFACKFIEIVSA